MLTLFIFCSPTFADEFDELKKEHIEFKKLILETDSVTIKANQSTKTSDYDKTIDELDGLTGTVSKWWDKNKYWSDILKSIDAYIEMLIKDRRINQKDIEIKEKIINLEVNLAVLEQSQYETSKKELALTALLTKLSIKEDIFFLRSENKVIASEVSYLRRVRKYVLQTQ
jgi:hypothetical protein